MLFQRLYNWIKYKTLPSSVLFKNRLFVERDSKHRRIFNNFGLTFRNSKWSNYEMYNVKFHFQWTYFKYFFWFTLIFLLIIVFTYFKSYYLYSYLMSTVSFLFWVSFDSFDYYLSFFIWLSIVFASMSVNFAYSYLFFNTYSEKQSLKEIFLDNFFNEAHILVTPKHKDKLLSKHEYSRVLYSWLINSASDNRISVLENLFTTKMDVVWWLQYHNFFRSLFKVTHLSQLSSKDSSLFFLQNLCLRLNLKETFLSSNVVSSFSILTLPLKEHSNLILWYTLKNYVNYFLAKHETLKSNSFLNNRNRWNLAEFAREFDTYAPLLSNKFGGFLLADFNFAKLSFLSANFFEFWSLNFYIKNQTWAGKWNRWLYKYSILHRKILKNSHKLTVTKRLINSGYFNNQLFSKNIWASEMFTKYGDNNSLFSSSFNLLYANLFSQTKKERYLLNKLKLTAGLSAQQSLEITSHYEASYFWIIKRFYFLNTLPSNFLVSTFSLNNAQTHLKQTSLNLKLNSYLKNYPKVLSYYLSSHAIVLKNFFMPCYSILEDNTKINLFLRSNCKINLEPSDFYLLNEENDFFTQENLNLLYWLTLTNLSLQQQVTWNSLFFYNNSSIQFSPSLKNTVNESFTTHLNYWLNFSGANSEKFFLIDAAALTMFF